MYKAAVIEDILIHVLSQLHVVHMSSDKRNIIDILDGTNARDAGIQQRDIVKTTSTSKITTGARDWQATTQGALDKRILRLVNIVKQILALNSRKG